MSLSEIKLFPPMVSYRVTMNDELYERPGGVERFYNSQANWQREPLRYYGLYQYKSGERMRYLEVGIQIGNMLDFCGGTTFNSPRICTYSGASGRWSSGQVGMGMYLVADKNKDTLDKLPKLHELYPEYPWGDERLVYEFGRAIMCQQIASVMWRNRTRGSVCSDYIEGSMWEIMQMLSTRGWTAIDTPGLDEVWDWVTVGTPPSRVTNWLKRCVELWNDRDYRVDCPTITFDVDMRRIYTNANSGSRVAIMSAYMVEGADDDGYLDEEWVCPECGEYNDGNYCYECDCERPYSEEPSYEHVKVPREMVMPLGDEHFRKALPEQFWRNG